MQNDIWFVDLFECQALNVPNPAETYSSSSQTLALVQLSCVGVFLMDGKREEKNVLITRGKKEQEFPYPDNIMSNRVRFPVKSRICVVWMWRHDEVNLVWKYSVIAFKIFLGLCAVPVANFISILWFLPNPKSWSNEGNFQTLAAAHITSGTFSLLCKKSVNSYFQSLMTTCPRSHH